MTRTRKVSVLIVDDSDLSRKMLNRALERRDYSCEEAEDGLQAVALVQSAIAASRRIDVILMDYEMPIMNGPTATKRIIEMGFQGVIFGVTGNVVQTELKTFLAAGARAVFPKPLDLDKLEATLASLHQELHAD